MKFAPTNAQADQLTEPMRPTCALWKIRTIPNWIASESPPDRPESPEQLRACRIIRYLRGKILPCRVTRLEKFRNRDADLKSVVLSLQQYGS
jgi:hypothetical protein